jgi:hypothetical protein
LPPARTTSCAPVPFLRSSHGGAAVSKADGRGFDSFRACSCRASSPDSSTLTTAEASSSGPAPSGPATGRSRHGAQLAVDQPSSDTGGSIPSRPTDARHADLVWHRALNPDRTGFDSQGAHHAAVAQPVVAPARQAGGRGCKSRRWRAVTCRRGRMDQGAGLRNRRVQVRPLPSTRSSP